MHRLTNNGIGKIRRYSLENVRDIKFLESGKIEKYSLNIIKSKDDTKAVLSAPIKCSLENFLLLKNTYDYFDVKADIPWFVDVFKKKENYSREFFEEELSVHQDINFYDRNFRERKAWKSYGLAQGIYSSILAIPSIFLWPEALGIEAFLLGSAIIEMIPLEDNKTWGITSLVYKTRIFKDRVHPKKLIKKINSIEKTLRQNKESYSLIEQQEEQLNDLIGKAEELSKDDYSLIEKEIKKHTNLRNSFDSLSSRKKTAERNLSEAESQKSELIQTIKAFPDDLTQSCGLHIKAHSRNNNSYEQVMDFYRKILGFKLQDFDLKKSVDKIQEEWEKVAEDIS